MLQETRHWSRHNRQRAGHGGRCRSPPSPPPSSPARQIVYTLISEGRRMRKSPSGACLTLRTQAPDLDRAPALPDLEAVTGIVSCSEPTAMARTRKQNSDPPPGRNARMGRAHPSPMPDPGADQRRPSLDQRNHTRQLEDVTSTCAARQTWQRRLLLLHPPRETSLPFDKRGGKGGHIQRGGGPLQQHGITCSRSAVSKKDGRSAVATGTVDGWRGGGLGLRRGEEGC